MALAIMVYYSTILSLPQLLYELLTYAILSIVMTKSTLSTKLEIEPSQLYVGDISKVKSFYADSLGLDVLESSAIRALLGHDNTGIIELISKPKLKHASPREAGLFHNAILFQSRAALSRAAGELIMQQPQAFSGTGDHLVSEAFYFNDPEGNGLELYFDRPQDSWQWQNGRVVMDTLYIDPLKYISTHAGGELINDKKIGHVHLRVGDISVARKFYVDTLGFDITAMMPGALFVSVGGYHHHIGLNNWLSEGAGLRSPALGLGDVTMELDNEDAVRGLAAKLESAEQPFGYKHGKLQVNDPWGNQISFVAPR